MITLITGGVKSGKSRRALELAIDEWRPTEASPVTFIATAEALDDEMRRRIVRHQDERRELAGAGAFVTIEEPLELDRAIAAASGRVVLDCLPMWINNIMYYRREADFSRLLRDAVAAMRDCVVVTNETGLGNIPFDAATRRYNTLLAEASRAVAAAADRVELLVAGIPLRIK